MQQTTREFFSGSNFSEADFNNKNRVVEYLKAHLYLLYKQKQNEKTLIETLAINGEWYLLIEIVKNLPINQQCQEDSIKNRAYHSALMVAMIEKTECAIDAAFVLIERCPPDLLLELYKREGYYRHEYAGSLSEARLLDFSPGFYTFLHLAVLTRNEELTLEIIKKQPKLLFLKTVFATSDSETGNTAAYFLIRDQNWKLLKKLIETYESSKEECIEKNAKTTENYEYNKLLFTALNNNNYNAGQLAKYLWDKISSLDIQMRNSEQDTFAHLAAASDRISFLKKIVQKEPKALILQNKFGETPISIINKRNKTMSQLSDFIQSLPINTLLQIIKGMKEDLTTKKTVLEFVAFITNPIDKVMCILAILSDKTNVVWKQEGLTTPKLTNGTRKSLLTILLSALADIDKNLETKNLPNEIKEYWKALIQQNQTCLKDEKIEKLNQKFDTDSELPINNEPAKSSWDLNIFSFLSVFKNKENKSSDLEKPQEEIELSERNNKKPEEKESSKYLSSSCQ